MEPLAQIAYLDVLTAEGDLAKAIARGGFGVRVEEPTGVYQPALGDFYWTLIIVYPLVRFVETFAARATDDAVTSLLEWIRHVASAYGHGDNGSIVIASETGVDALHLPSAVSPQALSALLAVSPDQLHGTLQFDADANVWLRDGAPLAAERTDLPGPLS